MGEVDFGFEGFGEGVGDGYAIDKSVAGEEFVEHDAEGPDVGAAIDGPASGLFGGHIGGDTEDEPCFGGARREGPEGLG